MHPAHHDSTESANPLLGMVKLTPVRVILQPISLSLQQELLFFIILRNCFLCCDCWNSDVMPTLDAALLCSSRVGSDLGLKSRLV